MSGFLSQLLARVASAGRRIIAFNPSRRWVSSAALSAATAVILTAGVSTGVSRTEVTLEVNGVSQPIVIWGGGVDEVLRVSGVELGDHDLVQPSLGTPLAKNDTVIVRTANEYTITVDGRARTVWSTSKSADAILADSVGLGGDVTLAADRSNSRAALTSLVSRPRTIQIAADGIIQEVLAQPGADAHAVLASSGIDVRPLDRVKISHSEEGSLKIDVTRVDRGQATQTIEIPFDETTKEDGAYFKGESVVTSKGEKGSAEQVVWSETLGGEATHSVIVSEHVTKEPQAQIRAQGTKEVTPEALITAGLDPKATLEEGTEADGTTSVRYRAKLGTLSSDAEINAIVGGLDSTQAAAAAAAAQSAGVPLVYSGEDPKAIARTMVAARGWSDSEFQCLVTLWNRESHWNPYAENASSGAYGIPQSLPGSKMASAGADWKTNPATQITWGLGYIAGRYGTPCSALGHSNSVGWY
ncbi:G5 domain-containing protein [Schaalia vaccimaxillae]|uniref:aggregation-promoting factor C-terminal-like domain-containing protein n=1 Tax=Schaalia vaccimaxillae TaxID=183916 RepID=UPI0003B47D2B|nr:G5 domain-containing protein [Schaalia vaccimaxillae]